MLETLAQTAPHSAELFTWPNAVALLTLTALEIVLGIDNVVFIALLSGRLPEAQRAKARQTGLALALITRVAFLFLVTMILRAATTKLFTFPLTGHEVSGKDLIVAVGGMFLIWKATHEIHGRLEDEEEHRGPKGKAVSFAGVVIQILLIDIVFSIDSVVTAVGMAQNIWVMVAAVVISVIIMLIFAGKISFFIEKHPTLKMLALAFLLMIGVVLVADGLGQHIPKGYVYFSMAFSLGVEVLNIVATSRRKAKKLAAPTAGAAKP